VLDPAAVIVWCVVGAVAGDAVSYWLGRRAGSSAWRHPALRARRRALARARLFFQRYGIASIYLCRFMGPVRAFVPIIAGVSAMKASRFQTANIGSAVIWVPVMLAPGYLAARGVGGSSSEWDAHRSFPLLAVAITATAAAALAWRRARRHSVRR
jgi:membrane protein DedA with SNARE-associated domain